jgi:hypothetical protein
MSRPLLRARRWALVVAAAVSLTAAGVIVWIFAPTFFHGLSTPELAAVVGLLVLPAATGVVMAVERRRVGA